MNKYIKLKNEILKDNIEFDIYIYIPFKNKYLKYLNQGELINENKLANLKNINLKKQNQLYTDINSYFNYKKKHPEIEDTALVDNKFYELNLESFIKAKASNYEELEQIYFNKDDSDNDYNNFDTNNLDIAESKLSSNYKEEKISENTILTNNILNNEDLSSNIEYNQDAAYENKTNFDNIINSTDSKTNIEDNIIEDKDLGIKFNNNEDNKINIEGTSFSNIKEDKIKYYEFEDERFIKKLNESEFEKIIKDKSIPDEYKEVLISNIHKTKGEGIIKKFTNVIKSNLKFYEFDQIDNFNKTIKRQQEKIYINEDEIKELGNKINERVVLDINNISDFKIKIKHLFINLNEAKTDDVEKILTEFTEFISSVLEQHDKDSSKISLSKPIDEICYLLAEKFNTKDYLIDHSLIVSVLASCIGIILESNNTKFSRDLCIGGILHDLGFIRLNETIIKKIISGEPMLKEDLELYKTHNTESYNIVSKVPTVSLISDIVIRIILQHHENPSKDAFPNQKSIMTQPIQVKIITISDLISYKIQNNTFTSFNNELNKLIEYQNSTNAKIFDLKLLKLILSKL